MSGLILKEDKILGEKSVRLAVKALGKEYLVPLAKTSGVLVGELRNVHVYYIVPDFHYLRRMEILSLLDKHWFSYYLKASQTTYFRKSKNLIEGIRRLHNFRRLYKSICKHSLVFNNLNIFSVPWLFASRECIYRFDGHHRASIARHLGYRCIMVRLVTPAHVRTLPNLPTRFRSLVNTLNEPDIDLLYPPNGHKLEL